MATSAGGGYCDCGDEEAFHAHAMCGKHKEAVAAANAKNAHPNSSPDAERLKRFPSDVRERAELLFSDICKYCMLVTSGRYDEDDGIKTTHSSSVVIISVINYHSLLSNSSFLIWICTT